MGCLAKLFNIGLTAVIIYQTWYNFWGANELGGIYLEWTALAYSIGTLLPAILLAIHNTKLEFAKSSEDKMKLADKKIYKYICYFYLTILAGMLCFRVFCRFQHRQNYPQHIVSFDRSRTWLIYYYGWLQYTFSFLLTFVYMYTTRKLAQEKASNDCMSHKVQSSSLIESEKEEEQAPTARYFLSDV